MSEVEPGLTTIPVRGIIFGHGHMAEGMVDALQRISGIEGAIVALSNEGRGPDDLKAAVDELANSGPAVVFTDLPSGSCAMAARLSCRGRGERAVICGANLPMLLDFLFHRDLPLDELVPRLVSKGRESMRSFPDEAE